MTALKQIPRETPIKYANEPGFAYPRWVRFALFNGVREGRFKIAFGSVDSISTALDELSRRVGFDADHGGRSGPVLTFEPYQNRLDPQAAARLADLLGCEFAILGPERSTHNGQGLGPRGIPTTLVVFFKDDE